MVYSLCILGFSALYITQDSEQNTRYQSPDPIQSAITKGKEVQISWVQLLLHHRQATNSEKSLGSNTNIQFF
jgi:hypothetical protein